MPYVGTWKNEKRMKRELKTFNFCCDFCGQEAIISFTEDDKKQPDGWGVKQISGWCSYHPMDCCEICNLKNLIDEETFFKLEDTPESKAMEAKIEGEKRKNLRFRQKDGV